MLAAFVNPRPLLLCLASVAGVAGCDTFDRAAAEPATQLPVTTTPIATALTPTAPPLTTVMPTPVLTPSVTASSGIDPAECYALLDVDGDGAKLPYDTCTSTALGSSDLWDDCDDTDPSKHQRVRYYRDTDGDGVGNVNDTGVGCEGEPPAGYVATTHDCNDVDASVQSWAHRDADGDGAGALVDECVAADATGYLAIDGDCDDSDPAVNSSAPEVALDYVDSDCDGFEFPVWARSEATVPAETALAVPDAARCAGVGLTFVGVESWQQNASSGVVVYVANRGTQPSGEQTTLTWTNLAGGDPVTWTLPSVQAQRTQSLEPFVTAGNYLVQLGASAAGESSPPFSSGSDASPTDARATSVSDAGALDWLPACPRGRQVTPIEVPPPL